MEYFYGNAEIIGYVAETGEPIINMVELVEVVVAATTNGETALKVVIPSEGSPFVARRDYVVAGAHYPPIYITRWEAEQLIKRFGTGKGSSGWDRDVPTLKKDCYSWKTFQIQVATTTAEPGG